MDEQQENTPDIPEMNTHFVDDDDKKSSGKKTSMLPFILGGVIVAVVIAFAGFMLVSSMDTESEAVYQPTAEDMAQRKIDADRDERAQRKVDQLRDQNVVVHENDVVVATPLVRGYEPPAKPPAKPSATDNADSDDDRKYQEEEEAIDLVLRGSMEAKKPVSAPAAEYDPPPRSVDGSSGGSGSQPAMFVYSREFGGARFVDKPQGSAPQSGDSLDDLTKAMLQTLTMGTAQASAPSIPDAPQATPVQNNKTQLIYSGLTPVVIHEGEMMEGVLVNRLLVNVEPSPVIVNLSRDLFDRSGQYVVFPANSRVIGTSQAISYKGASRLFISFHRVILPNGMSVDLPRSQTMMRAMDETGALGVVSHVNRHWVLQFGAAVFLGVIDGIAGYAQRNSQAADADTIIYGRASENFSRVLDRVMAQYSNIVPTIRVDQGKTLRIYVADDMVVSPYSRISDRSYYGAR